MASIKYVKSKKQEEATTTTTKNATKANTKAKIQKPAPKNDKTKKSDVKATADTKKATAKKETTKPATTKKATTTTAAKAKSEPAKAAAAKKAGPAKKAAPAKTATKKEEVTEPEAKPSRKRKAQDDADSAPAPAKKTKVAVKGAVLTHPPTQRLHVFVFGEGSAGELGLGTSKKCVDVKRPRLNPNLDANKVGVVQIAAGGMHCVALTHDNKVLTWGVNDQGALGRDTTWEGGLKDMDAADDSDSDDENDDNGLNPHESLPGEVDWSGIELAEGTKFTQVTAGDSTTFALTDDGRVYGWGTFRSNDGIFGLTPDTKIATRPILISGLKNIVSIKSGANHALAMDNKGAVFAWGSGQQNQLGRRVVERTKIEGLKPREFGLPKGAKTAIVSIETGGYHSFAISRDGSVYSWGLNNFGETGIMDNAGQDDAVIMKPQVVTSLKGKSIVSIKAGSHHSLAATADGECLIWGRMDAHQTGIPDEVLAKLPDEAVVRDEHGRARILAEPQVVSAVKGKTVFVTASSDHNLVVTEDGKAYSWGFSANYQTGQGTDDDVVVATLVDNTAVREKKLVGATAGGQFSVLTAIAEEVKVNGI